MPQKVTENGADMKEEEEVDNAGYLIIIAALLKTRKAKLKQTYSQLRNQIAELQKEILEMQESNQSQDYCSCSYEGGEDTPTGTRNATNDATNMPRYGFDVMSAAG